jgi:hypothetical protein
MQQSERGKVIPGIKKLQLPCCLPTPTRLTEKNRHWFRNDLLIQHHRFQAKQTLSSTEGWGE